MSLTPQPAKQLGGPSYSTAFIFLTTLFFLWGFITVLVDSLIPRIRELFTLTYFQAGLVQFAFFGAYFLVSIPAGYLLSKIGYKKGIVLGLLTMAVGCLLFYPAANYRVFEVFMLAYFVLASGITILQVAANPYVTVLGTEDGASSRLNLSQAFNSLGTTIAPAIGAMFLLSDKIKTEKEITALTGVAKESYLAAEAAAVHTPFFSIAAFIIVLALVFLFVNLPKLMHHAPKEGYRTLWQFRSLKMGAIGIFVYVGAEVAIGSYLVNYFIDMKLAAQILQSDWMRVLSESILQQPLAEVSEYSIVGAFVMFYWGGAMVGRFIGAYLTSVVSPAQVLKYFALSAIVLIVISINTTGFVAMWSILGVGLFNSIMFPTIFALALEGLEDLKPQASGILCTMIVGGAIIPPLYGFLTDLYGFKAALILVLFCYAYIMRYARYKSVIRE